MHMRRKLVFRLILIVSCLFLAGSLSTAAGPRKIAILPFTMNADRDLSFLQEGIVDMLASRIAWKGELEVIEKGVVKSELAGVKGALNRDAALAVGKRLGVDYVILGSLTVFGDSVSVDARILDVAKSEELITAFNQAKGMDAVIPTITQFAEDINEKVMGRPMAAGVQRAPSEAPSGPAGLIGGEREFEGKSIRHAQSVSVEAVGMDAGDVDGDGKIELVFISSETVHVYKWAEKAFVQFKIAKVKGARGLIYVSVADLDRNGKAEIYVSNIGEADVRSFVLEWDGKEFRPIAERVPWFLKVIDVPKQGKLLIGQRREAAGGFLGPVVYLNRQGNRFEQTGPVSLPIDGNIFNFTFVDFSGTGGIDTVLFDSTDHLRLYESPSQEIWKSDEPFGGAYAFISKENDDQSKDRIYISSPIVITDVDEDGQKEAMVCKNASKIGRLLARVRIYSSGTVHFMTRDQIGLSSKWITKKLSGAVVAYVVADVDHDNLPELVMVSVMSEEKMYGKPRSRIVAYDLK